MTPVIFLACWSLAIAIIAFVVGSHHGFRQGVAVGRDVERRSRRAGILSWDDLVMSRRSYRSFLQEGVATHATVDSLMPRVVEISET